MPDAANAQRYPTLDGMRGIAVLGILTINISAFALPDAAYFNAIAYGGDRPVDVATWGLNLVLVDGKMRNLFSFLFGASLLLAAGHAEEAGRGPGQAHFARMSWLLVFGLAHFYLIWSGDILTQYAVLGIAAWPLRRLSARRLTQIAAALLAVQFLIFSGFILYLQAAMDAAAAPGADAAALASGQWAAQVIGAEPRAIATEVTGYGGASYTMLVAFRLGQLTFGPILQLGATGAETLSMILLGMAGLKSGFVLGIWPRAGYRRVARIGLAIGLPIMLALLGWCVASNYDPLVTFAVVTALSLLARAALMLAYAALLILWFTRPAGIVAHRIAAAGRMALTNYLLTSIAMTAIFYGHGFGLFGQIGRGGLVLVVIGWSALVLAWSRPWLGHFRFGPFEWLWRSLAQGAVPPFRRLPQPSEP